MSGGMFKRGITRLVWKTSPETMVAVEELLTFREELAELRREVRGLRQDVAESRRDSLRIAELTDIVVEKLAEVERITSDGANGHVSAS